MIKHMLKHFMLGIIGVFLNFNPLAYASANLDYENWLHSIYVDFYGEALSSQEWEKAVSGSSSQSYTIQSGDSLYKISQNLLGSSIYWPKLWAVNSQLSNPHLIATNSQLNIKRPGGMLFNPVNDGRLRKKVVFSFKEVTEDGKVVEKSKIVLLPKRKSILRPVLKQFPASFPEWQGVYYQSQESHLSDLQITITKSAFEGQASSVFLDSMIIENSPDTIGEVLGSGRHLFYSKGQSMFIKVLGDFNIQPGQLLRVIGKKPIFFQKTKMAGGLLRIKAELRVLEALDNLEESFYKDYKVELTHSFFSSVEGDSIIAGGLKKFLIPKNFNSNKPLSRLGLIIGGKGVSAPILFGLESLVYLNVGLNESLSVGDTFPVYQNLYSRGGTTRKWNEDVAAYISVVDVKNNVATAVVSKIISDIKVGDRVGSFNESSALESVNENTFDDLDLEGEEVLTDKNSLEEDSLEEEGLEQELDL